MRRYEREAKRSAHTTDAVSGAAGGSGGEYVKNVVLQLLGGRSEDHLNALPLVAELLAFSPAERKAAKAKIEKQIQATTSLL